ncbi:MAG TPA: putative Ig domain-containing protein, partial [Bryobacteraceae bacterium]|nr:putative Ig domain-containing protein [Bryobacteraceae bacterium]
MVRKLTTQLLILTAVLAPALPGQSPLTITTPNALPPATVNQSYAVQLAATGGTTPYLWHFQSGGNPSARFTISSSGLISGTPSSADLGSLTMSVQVTDANSVTVTKQFTFTVQTTQPLTLTTKAFTPGVVGIPYSFQLQGTGGTQPYKWDVLPAIVTFPVPGQVAPGLQLDSATGLVTGTPTQAGTSSFTITLTDSASGSVSVPFTLTVSVGGPLGITTTSLPNGTVGAKYSQTLSASGGVPPYQWAVATGALPGGMSLDATTGVISGAPTTAASTQFTVTATDHAATPGTARQSLTLTVVAPAALMITTTSLPGGTQGAPYSQKIAATGGVPPYHWALTAGTLPAGLNLGADTGIIDGTPSAAGSSAFTVQAT